MRIDITITPTTISVNGHAENEACARVSTLCQSFGILISAFNMGTQTLEYGYSAFEFNDGLGRSERIIKTTLESCLSDLATLYPRNINLNYTEPNNTKEV